MQKTLSASLYEDDNQRDYNIPDTFDKFSGFICNNHLEIRCILRLI